MTDPAAENPTETPSTPETPAEKPSAAAPKPGRGAALPPTPAPPEARPGKKRGRPSNAEKAAREAGAAPAPATSAPAAPAGPPPWQDPAAIERAMPVAEGLTVLVHVATVAKGGVGLDPETAPLLAGSLAPCVAKYAGESVGPEVEAAGALAIFGLTAMRSAAEEAKANPDWRPCHPVALATAMRAARAMRKP